VNDDTWKAVASTFVDICIMCAGAGVDSVTETGEWTVVA
jgi:hypothetical protein